MSGGNTTTSPGSSANGAPALTDNTDLSPIVYRSQAFKKSTTETVSPYAKPEPSTPGDPFVGGNIRAMSFPEVWSPAVITPTKSKPGTNVWGAKPSGPWNDPIGTPTKTWNGSQALNDTSPDAGVMIVRGNGHLKRTDAFVIVVGPQNGRDWTYGGHLFPIHMLPTFECSYFHHENCEFFMKFNDMKDAQQAISTVNSLRAPTSYKGLEELNAALIPAVEFFQVASAHAQFEFFPPETRNDFARSHNPAIVEFVIDTDEIRPSSTETLAWLKAKLTFYFMRSVVFGEIKCTGLKNQSHSSSWEVIVPSVELAAMFVEGFHSRSGAVSVDGLDMSIKSWYPKGSRVVGPPSRALGHRSNVVDRAAIELGHDCRTTVMLRNIPNRINQVQLKQLVDTVSFSRYDFMYLRIDFRNNYNVGYGFFNFATPQDILPFLDFFKTHNWANSGKKADVSYATMQGRESLIAKFRNSSVMRELPTARPKLYFTDGPLQGEEEPFPPPDNMSKLERSIQQAHLNGLFAKGNNPHANSRGCQFQRQPQVVSHFDRGTSYFVVDEIQAQLAQMRHTWDVPQHQNVNGHGDALDFRTGINRAYQGVGCGNQFRL